MYCNACTYCMKHPSYICCSWVSQFASFHPSEQLENEKNRSPLLQGEGGRRIAWRRRTNRRNSLPAVSAAAAAVAAPDTDVTTNLKRTYVPVNAVHVLHSSPSARYCLSNRECQLSGVVFLICRRKPIKTVKIDPQTLICSPPSFASFCPFMRARDNKWVKSAALSFTHCSLDRVRHFVIQ